MRRISSGGKEVYSTPLISTVSAFTTSPSAGEIISSTGVTPISRVIVTLASARLPEPSTAIRVMTLSPVNNGILLETRFCSSVNTSKSTPSKRLDVIVICESSPLLSVTVPNTLTVSSLVCPPEVSIVTTGNTLSTTNSTAICAVL